MLCLLIVRCVQVDSDYLMKKLLLFDHCKRKKTFNSIASMDFLAGLVEIFRM